MASMRILITTQIVDRTDPGLGFFHLWIEEFATVCESVEVICLKKGDFKFPPNVTVTSLGKEKGGSRVRYAIRFMREIIARRSRYDSVFVHMNPEYVVLGGLIWRILGKRVGLWYTHRSVDLKLRIAARFMHIAFTGSKESFRIKSPKVLVTGQGVDTGIFAPDTLHRESSTPVLLVVGRISPIKNIELAIDTLEAVRSVVPGATLRIVGAIGMPEHEVYLDTLKERVHTMCLEDAVIFVGGKDSEGVREELGVADVFLHTSMTKSADKTAVEAMAMGVYQVTSSEVYQHDLPASCFQPPTALAYAREITRFIALPEPERVRLASIMRETAIREHSLERLVRLICDRLRQ